MIIHTVLGNRAHPEYGVASIPFPIPIEEYPRIIQTNYNSPNNSGYTSTNGWQYYDEVTIRGMQAILEHR